MVEKMENAENPKEAYALLVEREALKQAEPQSTRLLPAADASLDAHYDFAAEAYGDDTEWYEKITEIAEPADAIAAIRARAQKEEREALERRALAHLPDISGIGGKTKRTALRDLAVELGFMSTVIRNSTNPQLIGAIRAKHAEMRGQRAAAGGGAAAGGAAAPALPSIEGLDTLRHMGKLRALMAAHGLAGVQGLTVPAMRAQIRTRHEELRTGVAGASRYELMNYAALRGECKRRKVSDTGGVDKMKAALLEADKMGDAA